MLKIWAEKSFLQFLLLPPQLFPFLLSPVSCLLPLPIRLFQQTLINSLQTLLNVALLADENQNVILEFVKRNPAWEISRQQNISPLLGGDGFFYAQLTLS